MVVISAGVLISDCCHAVAVCADDKCIAYQCSACAKPCTASESLSEYHERLEAPKREHQRLKDAVVDAAKAWYHVELELTPKGRTITQELNTPIILAEAVAALNTFEAANKIE